MLKIIGSDGQENKPIYPYVSIIKISICVSLFYSSSEIRTLSNEKKTQRTTFLKSPGFPVLWLKFFKPFLNSDAMSKLTLENVNSHRPKFVPTYLYALVDNRYTIQMIGKQSGPKLADHSTPPPAAYG